MSLQEDKERLEKQLHEMAVAIERLENSRQKLLMEVLSFVLSLMDSATQNLSVALLSAMAI